MLNHNYHSEVFKRCCILLVLITVIVGVIAGFVFKTGGDAEISSYGYYISASEPKFNWLLMISIWISCLPLAAILYAVYSHPENQEITINLLNAIYNDINNEKNNNNESSPLTNFLAMDKDNKTWRCPQCNTVNLLKDTACKNCGYVDRGI